MIPEHLIEQIAQANDIVEVISGYFPLKRAGSAFKARCPFHDEKTASFSVNPARQIFKCFGCGAGGGVIKFVMLYENLNYPEAIKRLAARVGIRVEEEPASAEEIASKSLRDRLLSLHAATADWFHAKLMKSPAAQHARDYLKGRGISVEVAKSWKLGYAPDSWDALTNWARGEGYRDDELIASGLVTFKENEEGENTYSSNSSHIYDRFRDRLMFPICDKDSGAVIAFSGRVLSKDAFGGKYVNSPETPLFVKGKVLFGLHKTKRPIIDKKTAIICEGQIDLITAYEAGVQNVTAPQGTAFTQDQARILKRFADEVILCFDADAAGLKAAERSLPALLDAGLSVRVAEMPAGHDPDSLIREEGAEAFILQIEKAQDFFDFQIDRGVAVLEFATPKGKASFARKMAEYVSLVNDPLLRDAVINNVSTRMEMAASQFAKIVNAVPKQNYLRTADEMEQDTKQAEQSLSQLPRLSNTTRLLCQLVLLSSEVRAWVLEKEWDPFLQQFPEAELLVTILRGRFDPAIPSSVSVFLANCSAQEQDILAELLDEKHLPPDPIMVANDCWRDLERRDLERQRDVITARLRAPGITLEETVNLQQQLIHFQQKINASRRKFDKNV